MKYNIFFPEIAKCLDNDNSLLQDDVQYFRLLLLSPHKYEDVLIAEVILDDKTKYDIFLKGELEIFDYEGNSIIKANEYLKWINICAKENILVRERLCFDKLPFLEIVKHNNKNDESMFLANICYSLKDCFKVLSEFEKEGEKYQEFLYQD